MESSAPAQIQIQKRKHLVIFDASFVVFYRFHATRAHYAKSYAEEFETYPDDYNWLADKVFMDNFNRQFKKNIIDLPKNLGILTDSPTDSITYIWAQDCPARDIWRHKYMEGYKGTRKETHVKQKFYSYEIFTHVYEKLLPEYCTLQGAPHHLVKVANCEADDIVAQTVLNFGSHFDRVYIIASDTDYLQICDGEHIALYDLLGKKKIVELMGRKYLLGKIMCGDASDNIPACKFFRCSMKSISGHLDNPDKMGAIQTILDKIAAREAALPSTELMPTPALELAGLNETEIAFYRNAKVIDFTLLPALYKTNIKLEVAKCLHLN